MTARRCTTIAALAAAVCASLPAAASGEPAATASQDAQRPNIVFIMTDDQTPSSISVQRNVRLLQTQGTTFTRAIATFPLCCPSRATYLSGQYSHNHGVLHNAGPFGGYNSFDNTNSLPLWLQSAGYRTMHVGRYLNGYGVQNPDRTEIPPGWSDWVSSVGESVFNYRQWQINENGVLMWKPGADHPGEYQTDYFGRRAGELVRDAASSAQPFFLSLTFPAPHSGAPRDPDDPTFLATPSPAPRHRDAFAHVPLPRPPNFDEADVRAKPQIVADRPRLSAETLAAIQENYQQELESLLSVDDAVGTVLTALADSGASANTLVIYTSDNGFFHGEHRLRSEKVLPYDAAARIPLIVRGPGVPQGRRLKQMVGNIDWAPTIVDAADARAWRLMDGRSLFELFDRPDLETGRELVLENGVGANNVPMFRALRNERFLWVEHKSTGEYELYDIQKDPYELRNLEDRDAYEPIRAALAARLRKLQRCRGSRACSASRPAVRVAVRRARPARPPKRRRARRAACTPAPLRLALTGKDRQRVSLVRYFRGKRRIGVVRRPPYRVAIRRGVLRAGRTTAVRAQVVTVDGRRATYERRISVCPRGG